ncbi:hypothetical protein [Halolamina sediminis]|jgi:hypothetical protein|uniref:hypothetical protein n=1 Tax=Halolamina sediminis TaxID=1480675 RepID=UPI000B0C0FA2|nr:hypothetical protein [Halolamina sediminis]
MSLDIAVPDPPDLSNRGMPREFEWDDDTLGSEDFYREDLEDLLQAGAWREGFNEWEEYTDLDERQARAVSDLGLFHAIDFYWDPTEDRLRFDVPEIPEDWQEQDVSVSLDSDDLATIDTALTDLARTVYEVLEDYIDRNDTADGEGWGEDIYGDREE